METGNIDVNKIEQKISKKTKAIVVVHFLGVPVDMIRIRKIAKKYKLLILEDCALALGSFIGGKHVGLFGDAGVFSFYPVKHITTAEGGMLITNNKKIADKIRSKKAFGVDKNYNQRNFPGKYDVKELGLNYRMSEVHASIGVEQMKKIKNFLRLRRKNFDFLYSKLKKLKGINILYNKRKNFTSSNYCMNIILDKKYAKKRKKIINFLNDNGIGTSIYYPNPVPHMTYYKKKYKYNKNLFKNASMMSYHSIALSVGPHITLKHLDFVVKKIKKVIK
jgi:dTDP-4-amino-4,6-dideoxygalactose transaminase